MGIQFTNLTNLALDGFLGFGTEAEGKHSGLCICKIPVSVAQAASASATEWDSGFDVLIGWVILDAWINVLTTHAAKLVDVGTNSNKSGDANGLIVQASLATAGFVYADATVTVGGSETYYSANTRGALLADYIVGTNTNNDFGLFHKKPYVVPATNDITFTTTSATTTASFEIFLLILCPVPTAVMDSVNSGTMKQATA